MSLANPSVNGAEFKIPIYKDLVSATKDWSDGKFSIGDISAPADIGLGILNTALDPLGAIVGAAVEFLMDLLIKTVKPLGDAVDLLLGNPDAIYAHAQKWQKIAVNIATLGNEHASTVTAAPSWQSPAAAGYQQAQRAINESYISGAGAAESMGKWVSAVGAGVGIFRELMWGMLKDFITEIVKAAILALAAAIPSAGSSIGAFTGWLGIRAGMIAGKFASKLAKLMRWCAKISRKLGMSGKLFDKAAKSLSQAAQGLMRGARTGLQAGTNTALRRDGGTTTIPVKPKLPGDTRGDLDEGVKDFTEGYKDVTKYGIDPMDDYLNKGTGRGGDTEVRRI